MLDLFQLLSSPDVNWWTGVVWITCGLLWCFYQLFGLSFWRHPFTAEHPLLRQWCRDTFLQTWWRNKLILILDDLRVNTFSANSYFSLKLWSPRVHILFPCICVVCVCLVSGRMSVFVTLAEVLESRGAPLEEDEVWALLLVAAEALIDISSKGIEPFRLIFTLLSFSANVICHHFTSLPSSRSW